MKEIETYLNLAVSFEYYNIFSKVQHIKNNHHYLKSNIHIQHN